MAEPDLITVVERAYDLASDEARWMHDLASVAARVMGAPLGAFAYGFRISDELHLSPGLGTFATDMDAEPLLAEMHARADGPVLRHMYRDGPDCGSLADVVRSTRAPQELAHMARALFEERGGFSDLYVIAARGRGGRRMHLNFPHPRPLGASAESTIARWTLVARHLGAALRLRDAIDAAPSDALFTPEGRCIHAEGEVHSPRALARLRRAVVDRERARARGGRADPDRALALWQGLIEGRWTLLDRFDRDGRRFIVARENEPNTPDPRRFTESELRVARLLSRGLSTKVMATRLSVSNARIGAIIASLTRKTGSVRRADLVGLLSTVAPHDARRVVKK